MCRTRFSQPPSTLRTTAGRVGLLLALVSILLGASGCIQDISHDPEQSLVTGSIQIQGGGGRANIRCDVGFTVPRNNQSRDLILTPFSFTDENGTFLVKTTKEGPDSYVVARHPDYDIEMGILPEMSVGATTVLTSFLPTHNHVTGELSPTPTEPIMVHKTPGRVKFMVAVLDTAFRDPDRIPRVEILGDFNNFSKTEGLIQLFDDGSRLEKEDENGEIFFSGDGEPGDRIFTRIVDNLPPGKLRYNLLLNANAIVRDPFEESFERMVDDEGLGVVRSVLIVK